MIAKRNIFDRDIVVLESDRLFSVDLLLPFQNLIHLPHGGAHLSQGI